MRRMFRFAVSAVLCFALLAANLFVASGASGFYSKAEMVGIGSHVEDDAGLSQYTPIQGACIGGDYAYFAFVQGGVCNLAKYNAHSWKYITKQQIINMGHSNDICYNPDKGYLVVANNEPYYDVVTLVDPDTLKPIKDVKIDDKIYSIAYNAKRKCYVVGLSGGYDFAFLDSDFKQTKKFTGVKTGYTRQGCDCDDNYIYFVQSGGSNLLVVYDYSGKNVAQMPLGDSAEVENIFHSGNNFYTTLFYYGNTLYRLGFSDNTKITYQVSYDPGKGAGEMASTSVHYGEDTKLRKNSFTRSGYFFSGWRVQRTIDDKVVGYRNGVEDYEWLNEEDVYDYHLYKDEQSISKTVKYGGVKLTAMWTAERYSLSIDSGEGEGDPMSFDLAHDASLTLPDGNYSKEGYIFDGYTATRNCDGRAYGYRKDRDKAEWLEPDDMDRAHRFYPGDTVSALTPEGEVSLTARYKFAYTYSEDGTVLTEYVGVDEEVHIPDNDGKLTALGQGAFHDNEIMTELTVPEGVNTIEPQVITDCPKLRTVCFEGSLPQEIAGDSVVAEYPPIVYEWHGGERFCVGFFSDSTAVSLMQYHSNSLRRTLQSVKVVE